MLIGEPMKWPPLMLYVVLLAFAGAGCGGDSPSVQTTRSPGSHSTSVTTRATTPTETFESPDLGCDVVSMCVGEFVSLVLRACEARRTHLSAEDETARARLEELDEDGISPDEEPEALRLFGQLSGSCL